MKLAYFSDLVFPSNKAATKQIVKTIESLQKQNIDIDLFIPIPWRNIFRKDRISKIITYYGLSENFTVKEAPFFLPPIKKLHRRPFSYYVINKINKTYNLLYIRNQSHLRLGLSKGMRVLYETYKVKTPLQKSKNIISLLNNNENFIGIIVHSNYTRNQYISLGANPDKVITIHNGIDKSEVPSPIPFEEARRELNIPINQKIISYIGNMGDYKNIESILDLAKFLPEFTFYLVGAQLKKDINRLNKYAKTLDITNYKIINWLPPA